MFTSRRGERRWPSLACAIISTVIFRRVKAKAISMPTPSICRRCKLGGPLQVGNDGVERAILVSSFGDTLLISGNDLAEVFRVTRRECGRTNEVREHHRHLAALGRVHLGSVAAGWRDQCQVRFCHWFRNFFLTSIGLDADIFRDVAAEASGAGSRLAAHLSQIGATGRPAWRRTSHKLGKVVTKPYWRRSASAQGFRGRAEGLRGVAGPKSKSPGEITPGL